MKYKMVELGTLITQAKTVRCGESNYPVLSMTMHDGLVLQDDRFKKAIASKDKSDYKVVYRDQLVISFPIDEGVLATQRITDAGIVSPAYGIWDVDQEKVVPEFLEYALRCERSIAYYKAKLRGSTARRRSLPTPTLLAHTVPLPSVEEQKNILDLIHRVETIIHLRKDELRELDALTKARFVEMFGLPGMDPFKYGKTKLASCCEINPKKAKDSRLVDNIEISFVPMTAVSEKGEIDSSDVRRYEDVKKGFTYFIEGDVLFAKITPCMENGKGAVAKGLKNGIGFGSTEFHVLRPIDGISNPYWVYAITSFKSFRKEAESNMTGSAGQRRTPASFLENYEVSLPPIELQNQFADFVAQTNKSKLLEAQQSNFIAKTRQTNTILSI